MMPSIHPTHTLSLGLLLQKLAAPLAPPIDSLVVSGVQIDSRKVRPGDLFLACSGYQHDGRRYIAEAIAAGAVAVVSEALYPEAVADIPVSSSALVPIIKLAELSSLCSEIAGRFYHHPSRQMPVLAVTGTNGKTSCSQLMMQLLVACDKRCAVIGTLGMGVDGQLSDTGNTTPDAVSLQRQLASWQLDGVDVVAMEASSHGLAQGRLAALEIELALLTNLSRDHLDYHGSMQAYANAKALLFQQPGLKYVVLNDDDSFSRDLLDVLDAGTGVVRYSIEQRIPGGADVWVDALVYSGTGVSGMLHTPWGDSLFSSPLLGGFNLSNLLAVIACLAVRGQPLATLVAAARNLQTIAGRMEAVVCAAADINVVVDYAHTPDALEQALKALRLHNTAGKLWCVFGCGGDRDQGKRPKMGSAVEHHCDHVIVTSDNPRFESAEQIINEILSGVQRPSLVEADRAKAIEFAVMHAASGDSILIAGKGHEQYQQLGDEKIPFDDFKQARLALAKRCNSGGGQ